MSNPLKYSTSTPTGALRHDTLGAGVANIQYDENWNSGVTPNTLTSYYLIYEPVNGTAVRVYAPANAAELIKLAQSKGSSETTEAGALTWLSSNGYYPANKNLDSIVTDSLKFAVDSTTATGYPRSGTTWLDLSGVGINGSLVNSPQFDENSESLIFDGTDDYVTIGTGDDFPYPYHSLEMWINISSLGGSNQDGLMAFDYGRYVNIAATGNITYVLYYNQSGPNTAIFGVTTSNVNVLDGKWHQVMCTRGTSVYEIWVDGVLEKTGGNGGQPTWDGTNVWSGMAARLANNPNNVGYNFNGKMSVARVYNKQLSTTEILHNYFQGPIITDDLRFSIDPSNLISFQKGTTIAYNQTGSVNGTLTNGVSFSSAANGVWDFDGIDDMIDTPSLTETDLEFLSNPSDTGGLTYSIWSKNDSSSSYYLLSTGSQTSSTGVALSYQAGNGFVSLDTGTKEMSFGISSYWPLNEWVHFTFVQDKLTWYFYKNGIQIGTGGINGTSAASDLQTKLRIAGPNNSTCCRFDGQVGSVLVYDRALTSAEVQQNYNANVKKYT